MATTSETRWTPGLPSRLARLAAKHHVGLATWRGHFLVYRPGTDPLAGFIVRAARAVPRRIRWVAASAGGAA